MSDEKLTVAELLARRNKERGDSAGSEDRPRRRRRSLEEGGVSVAELTGSIPRVKADGPRRGSHAVVEDDELDDEQVVESAEAADSTEAVEPVEPVEAAEPVESAEQYDEDGSAEAEYADELAAAEEFGDEPIADEPVADEAIADETVDEEPAGPRDPFSVPSAVPVDPRPVMANDETGEITFTFTKFHDARTASEPVAEVGPMGREVLEGSMAYDDRPTNIIPVVDEDPADPFDAPDDVDDRSRDDRAFDGSAIAGGAIGAAAAPAVAVGEADKATKKSRDDYAEDNSLSIGLLIVQTIVGLLFGGLVFALFMMLWMVLPTAVVAVIAVAFAFGLVVVVNLIRRERDRLTPILVGIVGLVVSFAPYVLTMM